MARSSNLLSPTICFLVLFHGCFARIDLLTNRGESQRQQQQQQSQSQCQFQNLNALEPQHRYKSEAGVTEFWDQNEKQFQCAGVAFLRHKIQRKGLLLPSFDNAPQLFFVVEGQGIHGAIFPGCPETFQSQSKQQSNKQQSSQDQHQKIRRINEGDVFAMPAGVSHWIYNNGQSQLVLVSLVDVGNNANQLDQNFRKFFLAGNPQEELVRGGQSQSQNRDQSRSQSQGRSQRGQEEEQQESSGGNNILSGFSEKLLAEVFGIDTRLARKLQSHNDNRGAIVKVENEFEFTSPEEAEEEQRQQEEEEEEEQGSEEAEEEQEQQRRRRGRRGGDSESSNGLEETFCTMRLKHGTESSNADIFNPRAGRITTVNSFKLPVLHFLQLSAERGVLFKDAIYAPHWNLNAHSILYVTRGNGRIQIVAENGEAIFDDQVEEGQVITVPQNHAVVKKAGNQGFEWIAFKTNADAKISQINGRVSVFRGLPVDVLANSFDISWEEAMRLKQSRREVSLFSPRQGSQSQAEQ